ncbi:MAG: sulfatase-like hydrolase/transferase [Proteobacteria bacterium]|nr:sulfatase-like hydrolase/transferase [Pseudomonadota bacterium]
MQRPNILWIYIEDQDPRYGCYGEELVNTPVIDSLAADGVLFQRAYSPAPVCSPSRSAIITGSDAIRVGVQHQRSSRFPGEEIYLPEGVETVPELFRKAGYFTFNRGKDDYNFVYDRTKLYSTGNTASDPGKLKGVQAGAGNWNECPEDMPFFAQLQTNGGKHAYSHGDLSDYMATIHSAAVDPADVTVPPQYPNGPSIVPEL